LHVTYCEQLGRSLSGGALSATTSLAGHFGGVADIAGEYVVLRAYSCLVGSRHLSRSNGFDASSECNRGVAETQQDRPNGAAL
jgi:hypothetical protein